MYSFLKRPSTKAIGEYMIVILAYAHDVLQGIKNTSNQKFSVKDVI